MDFHETDLPELSCDEVYEQIQENRAKVIDQVGDPEINISLVEIVTSDDPLKQFQNLVRESSMLATHLLQFGFTGILDLQRQDVLEREVERLQRAQNK
ncbi:MAG TPA: hypothetical protein EYQ63_11995 [Fuerstia sp.]|nr:hypothetical protein [Fuerstiella sp.]